MGIIENWRRRKHRASIDWDLTTRMVLWGRELSLADADGSDRDTQQEQADRVMEAALADIGGMDVLREHFIEAQYEYGKGLERTLDYALEKSGYAGARERLFPELTQSVPRRQSSGHLPRKPER